MRRLLTVLGMVGGFWSGAAHATGSIDCDAVDVPDVTASILVSRLVDPMTSALRADFNIAGTWYTTTSGEAAAEGPAPVVIAPLHQYGDAHNVVVEYADEQMTQIIVSLRLVQGSAGDGHAMAGVLTVHDVGAWAVTCLLG